jgi:hypothetical protein
MTDLFWWLVAGCLGTSLVLGALSGLGLVGEDCADGLGDMVAEFLVGLYFIGLPLAAFFS